MENKTKHREMAKRVLGYLTAFPEKHDQDSWVGNSGIIKTNTNTNVCPTTLCVAGTAVYLDGGNAALKATLQEEEVNFEIWEVKGGKLLGLNDEEAYRLFYESDNKEAIALLKAVAKGNQKKFDRLSDL